MVDFSEISYSYLDLDNDIIFFSDENGIRFYAKITEDLINALNSVSNKETKENGASVSPVEKNKTLGDLTPRQIQILLRKGISIEQITKLYHVDVNKVKRYSKPVFDEINWIISTALDFVVLGQRFEDHIIVTLTNKNVSVDDIAWSARKGNGAFWTLRLTYKEKNEVRLANWAVDVKAKQLLPLNDLASILLDEPDLVDDSDNSVDTMVLFEALRESDLGNIEFDQNLDQLLARASAKRGKRQIIVEDLADDKSNRLPRGESKKITKNSKLSAAKNEEEVRTLTTQKIDFDLASRTFTKEDDFGEPSSSRDSKQDQIPQGLSGEDEETPESSEEAITIGIAQIRDTQIKNQSSLPATKKMREAYPVNNGRKGKITTKGTTTVSGEKKSSDQVRTGNQQDNLGKNHLAASQIKPEGVLDHKSLPREVPNRKSSRKRQKVPSWEEIMFGESN